MKDRDWVPLSEIERRNNGLPFPENFYRAEGNSGIDNDGLFISDQLSRLTLAQRSRAAMAYSDLYEGVDSRRDCNNRLRAFADRCVDANNGVTIKPRVMK